MRVVRIHWLGLLKRLLVLLLLFTIFYSFCVRKKRYSEQFVSNVNVADPKLVWEFMADFTNQQRLQPAITDFEIEYERGNYENWEYGVRYGQQSVRFPLLQFQNRGVFKVLPHKGSTKQPFRILTTITSCTLGLCQEMNFEMRFSAVGGGGRKGRTEVDEKVYFDCAPILAPICISNVRADRRTIHDNIMASSDFMNI